MSEERLADGMKQLDRFCEGLSSVDFSTLSFCFYSIKRQFPEIWLANPETKNIWVAEDFNGLRENAFRLTHGSHASGNAAHLRM